MTNKEHAIIYASKGYKIFPLWWIQDEKCACGDPECGNPASRNNPGKHPIAGNPKTGWIAPRGRLNSTSDVNQIAKWWDQYPKANIALDCAGSGLVVIDVDLHDGGKNGFESLDDWETTFKDRIHSDVSADTGGGGVHLIYRMPSDVKSCPGGFGANYPAIDLKFNGYILLAPSNHKSGINYSWSENGEELFLSGKVPPLPRSVEKYIREGHEEDKYSPVRYSAPSRVIDSDDEEQIREALNCISFFSLNDDERLKVGMGLQQALPGGRGKAFYFEWLQSNLGGKFSYKLSEKRWRSFKYRSGGRSIASFYEVAASCGFVNEGKRGEWIDPKDFVYMEPSLVAEKVDQTYGVMFVQDEIQPPMYVEEYVLPAILYIDDDIEAAPSIPDVPQKIEIVKYHGGADNMSMKMFADIKNKYLESPPDKSRGMPTDAEWKEWFARLKNNKVLCSLFRWQVENSTTFVPELAVAFTLSSVGGLLSGRFRHGSLTTNLYFMVIVESTAGKSVTLQLVRRIFEFAGDEKRIGPSDIISDKGFINDLIINKARFFPLDEIGELFSNIFSPKANASQKMIKKALLDGFTSFGMKTNVTASRADAKNAPVQDIGQTSPTILGVTTPAKIYESFSSTDIIDGLLNRLLVMANEKKNIQGKMSMETEMPSDFTQWFFNVRSRWNQGGLMFVEDSDTCSELQMTDQARHSLTAIKEIEGRRKELAGKYGAIWGRLTEITIRLSIIFELTERPYSGMIEDSSVVAAYELVSWCIERSEDMARTRIADSEEQAIAKEVLHFIDACPNGALYQDITEGTRLGANMRIRAQIISSLKDEQRIKEFSYKADKTQRGRPQKIFFTPQNLKNLAERNPGLASELNVKGLEI